MTFPHIYTYNPVLMTLEMHTMYKSSALHIAYI